MFDSFEFRRDRPVSAWISNFRTRGGTISEDGAKAVAAAIVDDATTDRRTSGKFRFRPSMLGTQCQRAHILSYVGAMKDQSKDEWLQMADAGTWLHYKWQAELSSQYVDIDDNNVLPLLRDIEVPIEIPEWKLRGQADGLMTDNSVLEIKTLSDPKFKGYRGSPSVENWDDPPVAHRMQILAYMRALGCGRGSLVYVNRSSNEFREFRLSYDYPLMEKMDAFFADLNDYLKRDLMPKMLPSCKAIAHDLVGYDSTGTDKPWQWCGFMNTCFHMEKTLGTKISEAQR